MALAGCGGGEPKSAPSPSSAPPSASASAASSPKEGACYNLTYDEALAPTAGGTAVSCKGKHTTQTYAVGRLRNVVDGHLVAVDSEQVAAQVAEACPNKVTKYLGGDADDLRLSMLRPVWFTPTIKESEAGANWFRCDVIGIAGPKALMTLKGNMKGVLGDSDTAEPFRMCGTASPKSEYLRARPVLPQAHLAGPVGHRPRLRELPRRGEGQQRRRRGLQGRCRRGRRRPAQVRVVLGVPQRRAVAERADVRDLLGPGVAKRSRETPERRERTERSGPDCAARRKPGASRSALETDAEAGAVLISRPTRQYFRTRACAAAADRAASPWRS